jgi:predicted Holliday junction resolvase-like endonuclease
MSSSVLIAVLTVLVLVFALVLVIAVRFNKQHLATAKVKDAAIEEKDAEIIELLHWKDTHPYTEEQKEKLAENKFRGGHSSMTGKVVERVAPFLPNFPYNPKDVQWVGGLIDALVWDGCSEGKEITVVALEYKTGRGQLSADQRRVMEAIDAGRFRYELLLASLEPEVTFEPVVARPVRRPRLDSLPVDSVTDWEEWKKEHRKTP